MSIFGVYAARELVSGATDNVSLPDCWYIGSIISITIYTLYFYINIFIDKSGPESIIDQLSNIDRLVLISTVIFIIALSISAIIIAFITNGVYWLVLESLILVLVMFAFLAVDSIISEKATHEATRAAYRKYVKYVDIPFVLCFICIIPFLMGALWGAETNVQTPLSYFITGATSFQLLAQNTVFILVD